MTFSTLRRRHRLTVVFALVASGCATPQSSHPRRYHPRGPGDPAGKSAAIDTPAPKVADPVLDNSATVEDYLAYAAMNNAGLEAAFNRWRAAVERVPQVESLPDPRLTYRYFIKEVETRVGPQKQGVGLSQTFPWFGKLGLRGDAAGESAGAERQRYESAKLALFYEVKQAYNDYYYLGRAIAVVQENLGLIEYLEGVARARYRTAAASHPDVIRAQVELGKLEDQLKALRELRGPIVARLNAALNRPAAEERPFPDEVSHERLEPADDVVITMMAENNPELRALEHRIKQSQYEFELTRKEYYPDLTLGVEYTEVGQPPRSGAPGFSNPAALRSASRISSGIGDVIDSYAIGRSFAQGPRPDDAGQDIWMVSLSMNLPIWQQKYAAGEREAYARKLATMSERKQREHDLTATVKRALYEYRDAERKILLYRDTLIPKAKESIESTETAFRAGAATFLELVDAERSLLKFELSYERALANRSTRLAELDRLVGTAVPRLSSPDQEERPAPVDSDD